MNNVEKLKESLVNTLIEKTENYEIEWKWFKAEDKYNKDSFLNSLKQKRVFPYDYENVSDDFPEKYSIIAEESMFAKVKYYEKNKNGKEYVKGKLRYGLIKGYNEESNTSHSMLSLVCDREGSKTYTPIITSNSSKEYHEKLEQLYYLAEFTMHKEIKLIEKWMNGEFESIGKEIKEKEKAKKLEKKEKKKQMD